MCARFVTWQDRCTDSISVKTFHLAVSVIWVFRVCRIEFHHFLIRSKISKVFVVIPSKLNLGDEGHDSSPCPLKNTIPLVESRNRYIHSFKKKKRIDTRLHKIFQLHNMKALSLRSLASLLATTVGVLANPTTTALSSLPPIEIQHYKFFDSSTGEEFVVKGIDYYPRPNTGELNANSVDLFTNEHADIWERDIPYLQELGVNAIRLYAVNATANHDAFM